MTLSVEEAVRRVEAVVDLLIKDVRHALALHISLEVANNILPPALEGQFIEGAQTFMLTRQALMMKLALDVARIYDWSARYTVEQQDKASVPVLARLLALPGVADEFAKRARQWTPGVEDVQERACRAAISVIIGADNATAQPGTALHHALKSLREFRNSRLAHMLFDREPDRLPMISEVFALLDASKPVLKSARLVVFGDATEPDWEIDQWRESATAHYEMLLAGIRAHQAAS